MIKAGNTFLIDLTGFLEASQKAFLGAPCLVVDGEDHTFFVFLESSGICFSSGIRLASSAASLY
jgi:hypothetical protein